MRPPWGPIGPHTKCFPGIVYIRNIIFYIKSIIFYNIKNNILVFLGALGAPPFFRKGPWGAPRTAAGLYQTAKGRCRKVYCDFSNFSVCRFGSGCRGFRHGAFDPRSMVFYLFKFLLIYAPRQSGGLSSVGGPPPSEGPPRAPYVKREGPPRAPKNTEKNIFYVRNSIFYIKNIISLYKSYCLYKIYYFLYKNSILFLPRRRRSTR